MANRNCNIARILVPGIMMGTISLSSNVLRADDYKLGLDAISKSQYTQAFQLIKASAEKGEVKSKFILSTMYRRGLGVDLDEYKGFDRCKMASGCCLRTGHGHECNPGMGTMG